MKRLSGFSLMEMMVVLLIVAVVAAASAPMIARKTLIAASDKSPWVWTTGSSIAYNLQGKNMPAIIGGVRHLGYGDELGASLSVIADDSKPAISFGTSDGFMRLLTNGKKLGIVSNGKLSDIGENSVVIGYSSTAKENAVAVGAGANTGKNSVAIGYSANTKDFTNGSVINNAIAIGANTIAAGTSSIAIGGPYESVITGAKATGVSSIAIGNGAQSLKNSNIAIGYNTFSAGEQSIAIGNNARAEYDKSIAIGHFAKAKAANQIVLGDANSTVYIPGNLVVGKYAVLNSSGTARIWMDGNAGGNDFGWLWFRRGENMRLDETALSSTSFKDYSDRRLKNVGKAFTGGLEEIKKLEVFNFTFKKDPDKTPRVGVMAQDLQKIFPNAVFKGDDGFLRIRMEDMFYAVVNAVKELDSKIEALKNQEILTLKNRVDKLEKENKALEKRLSELEKKLK